MILLFIFIVKVISANVAVDPNVFFILRYPRFTLNFILKMLEPFVFIVVVVVEGSKIFKKLTISLLSTSLLIPQSWKTTRARTTSIVVFDLKAALWSCVRGKISNNFIVNHCLRIHDDREIVFVHYS